MHQVVRKGADVDLTRLPFHLQHEFDGGVYISASIDYAVDPATGKRNVGCRRLMLRSRDTMRANLTDASDLKLMYLACLKRGERLPVSYVIGSHPLDYLAATQKQPVDEFALVGTVRGEPVPMVRGVSNGVHVPADAEAVIEGYFDELGYREMEGPYGEFYGYYGSMHIDPVFHATAITMRRDAHVPDRAARGALRRTDGFREPRLAQCRGERLARAARGADRAGGDQLRAREQRPPALPRLAQARRARAGAARDRRAVLAAHGEACLHRRRGRRCLLRRRSRMGDGDAVQCRPRHRGVDRACPASMPIRWRTRTAWSRRRASTAPRRTTSPTRIEYRRAVAPKALNAARSRNQSVAEALQTRAMHFGELVAALGSADGREIALALDGMREQDLVTRLPNGEWALKDKK